MAELTMGVKVDGLKELTQAVEEFNHNRSYIDGLEAWILRSESENERLREQNEQLKQPARGVDGSTAITISGLSGVINPDEIARAINESIRDQSERVERVDLVQRLRDELSRVDAALGLPHTATPPHDPREPVHPRLWEIEKLKTLPPAILDPSWVDLFDWARKNLGVPHGDRVAPHILRALQDRAGLNRKLNKLTSDNEKLGRQLDARAEQLSARDKALIKMVDWVRGAPGRAEDIINIAEDALKC